MPPRKIIVFGPTGAVGSATALTAAELGGQVFLAMRDTAKPIPGLTADIEKIGNFERVHADLTKPDTVRDAVTKTGATYAFVYLAHGTSDNMKATIAALKAAGVELVVFLSSFTVRGDLKAIQPSEAIPYIHAQVELSFAEVYGADGFIAVRPGSFASNSRQYKEGFEKGEIKVFGPDARVDSIVQEDIGRVCGTVLAKGLQEGGERVIYLYGPEVITQLDQVRILAGVLGKDPKIVVASEEDARKMFVEERKMPAPYAEYMMRVVKRSGTGGLEVVGYPVKEEELSNVEKYSGRKGTTFEEWAEQNKNLFMS
jgi:uncharacterized protein YbjT (DUF2867 family)